MMGALYPLSYPSYPACRIIAQGGIRTRDLSPQYPIRDSNPYLYLERVVTLPLVESDKKGPLNFRIIGLSTALQELKESNPRLDCFGGSTVAMT